MLFQSTRPRGARLAKSTRLPICHHGFNPRAREGRDTLQGVGSEVEGCFNPRAREGRDCTRFVHDEDFSGVSIHAPARGAT